MPTRKVATASTDSTISTGAGFFRSGSIMPRMRWSVGDLLVSVVLVLMLSVFGLAAQFNAGVTADRARCASNLHQLGLGIILYQNDNNQSYPRTIMGDPSKDKPTWGTPYKDDATLGSGDANPFDGKYKPAADDVTAAFFLLLRQEMLTPAVFTCPESGIKPWDFGGGANTAQNWTNWSSNRGIAKHLSYSYQNPYPTNDAIAAGWQFKNPDATFAVASDMNPGGDAVTKVKIDSPADQMKAANSLNHGGEGQNVLFGDGHVEWETTPFCGTQHDNIFTAAGPEITGPGRGTAVIVASSVDANDSILLPTAADVGYHPKAAGKPLTPEQRDALTARLIGKYTGGGEATLTIDAKTMHSTAGPDPVDYTYQVIGGTGDTLVCKITTGGTTQRATVSLDEDGELDITLPERDPALDADWKRQGADKPAAGK
jgi:prepilin-type processing-associated H-X9-DG protein